MASMRAPLSRGPRAVKIEINAPTPNSAAKLSNALAVNATAPDAKRYGRTGTEAPRTNAVN